MVSDASIVAAAAAVPSRKADGQPSTVAAAALMAEGAMIPPVLTETSPSVIAMARLPWFWSASAAQNLIVADVPSKLMRKAAVIVSG